MNFGWNIKIILVSPQYILLVTRSKDDGVAEEANASGHSAVCLRLMRVFPRVVRGMRRYQDQTTPQTHAPLGPRHVAALEQLRDGPLSVGTLAARLGLTLSTVSGVLAGLDQAGFVERSADQADRRRTIIRTGLDGRVNCAGRRAVHRAAEIRATS